MGNLYNRQKKTSAIRHGESIYTINSLKFPSKYAS